MKKRRRKKKFDTSLKVIIVMGVFAAVFIVVMIVTFWAKGAVPDTLIQYTLGAGGVEAFLLAGIKISKVLTETKAAKDAAKQGKEAGDICSNADGPPVPASMMEDTPEGEAVER